MVDEELWSRNDGLPSPRSNPRSRNNQHVKLMDAHDADIVQAAPMAQQYALQPLGGHGYFYHVGVHLFGRVYPRRKGCSSRQPSSSGACSSFFKTVGTVVRTEEGKYACGKKWCTEMLLIFVDVQCIYEYHDHYHPHASHRA